jgi:hypothetical protein
VCGGEVRGFVGTVKILLQYSRDHGEEKVLFADVPIADAWVRGVGNADA